jgi:hypothetical protein
MSYNMVKKMTQSGALDLNVSEQCLHLVVTSFHKSPVMASAPDSIDERIIISTKFCSNHYYTKNLHPDSLALLETTGKKTKS